MVMATPICISRECTLLLVEIVHQDTTRTLIDTGTVQAKCPAANFRHSAFHQVAGSSSRHCPRLADRKPEKDSTRRMRPEAARSRRNARSDGNTNARQRRRLSLANTTTRTARSCSGGRRLGVRGSLGRPSTGAETPAISARRPADRVTMSERTAHQKPAPPPLSDGQGAGPSRSLLSQPWPSPPPPVWLPTCCTQTLPAAVAAARLSCLY